MLLRKRPAPSRVLLATAGLQRSRNLFHSNHKSLVQDVPLFKVWKLLLITGNQHRQMPGLIQGTHGVGLEGLKLPWSCYGRFCNNFISEGCFSTPQKTLSSQYLHALCISDSVWVNTSATLWKINSTENKTSCYPKPAAKLQTDTPEHSGYLGVTTYKTASEIQNGFFKSLAIQQEWKWLWNRKKTSLAFAIKEAYNTYRK